MCRTYKNKFGHVQNLQKSIRTCAELTKINSDMCRTYKNKFGHVQNLQKSIRTCAELTRSVKILLKIRTHPPISEKDILPVSPLHTYLCVFRLLMLVIYHLDVGTTKWSPTSSQVQKSINRMRKLLSRET